MGKKALRLTVKEDPSGTIWPQVSFTCRTMPAVGLLTATVIGVHGVYTNMRGELLTTSSAG